MISTQDLEHSTRLSLDDCSWGTGITRSAELCACKCSLRLFCLVLCLPSACNSCCQQAPFQFSNVILCNTMHFCFPVMHHNGRSLGTHWHLCGILPWTHGVKVVHSSCSGAAYNCWISKCRLRRWWQVACLWRSSCSLLWIFVAWTFCTSKLRQLRRQAPWSCNITPRIKHILAAQQHKLHD